MKGVSRKLLACVLTAALLLSCQACTFEDEAQGTLVTNGSVSLSVGMSREKCEALMGASFDEGWASALNGDNIFVTILNDTIVGLMFGGDSDWRTGNGVSIGMSDADVRQLLGAPEKRETLTYTEKMGERYYLQYITSGSDKLTITFDEEGNAYSVNMALSGYGSEMLNGMAYHLANGDKNETLEDIRFCTTSEDLTGMLLHNGIVKLTYDGTGVFKVTTDSGGASRVLADCQGAYEGSFPAAMLDSFSFDIVATDGKWDIRVYTYVPLYSEESCFSGKGNQCTGYIKNTKGSWTVSYDASGYFAVKLFSRDTKEIVLFEAEGPCSAEFEVPDTIQRGAFVISADADGVWQLERGE